MDDLTATKLCAEAMGLKVDFVDDQFGKRFLLPIEPSGYRWDYQPLLDSVHGDSQAMALVKRFGLQVSARGDAAPELWLVAFGFSRASNYVGHHTEDADLNRAIVYCVAKMINAKPPTPAQS